MEEISSVLDVREVPLAQLAAELGAALDRLLPARKGRVPVAAFTSAL